LFGAEKMDKYQRLAHKIIDLVEFSIRETHPAVDAKATASKGNTLLYGENYYNLENEISEILQQHSQ
jgi:hypothetical protein